MEYEELLQFGPYELKKKEKQRILTGRLAELTLKHMRGCEAYERMMESVGFSEERLQPFAENGGSYYDLPFLPVRLFKLMELRSVPQGEVFKTLTSSGTTGQAVSKIYCDRSTASNQQKTMVRIVSDFTGNARMPMLIIDCPSVVKNRRMFSARGAGILGFSVFGTDRTYALDDGMNLDVEAVEAFLQRHKGERIFLFGFTFMIWQHFYRELLRLHHENKELDLSGAVLIHGGGWKKLRTEAVDAAEFKRSLKEMCGISQVYDYYGMVEQTGCIYMECECGHLHASSYSDVIIRRGYDFSPADVGEPGIVQVVSAIPESYPGHSLLTEDEGILLGEDDCPCGRAGKYFRITGRLQNAEIRGCSDTYAADFG